MLYHRTFQKYSPQTVEDIAIRIHSKHDVICGGVVDERSLGVDEEHVWYPNLFHQPTVKGQTLVVGTGKRQAFVLPVVS